MKYIKTFEELSLMMFLHDNPKPGKKVDVDEEELARVKEYKNRKFCDYITKRKRKKQTSLHFIDEEKFKLAYEKMRNDEFDEG